jgi:hypothetical protein
LAFNAKRPPWEFKKNDGAGTSRTTKKSLKELARQHKLLFTPLAPPCVLSSVLSTCRNKHVPNCMACPDYLVPGAERRAAYLTSEINQFIRRNETIVKFRGFFQRFYREL